MRIACPSCAAEYEVPASRLTPGRKVRCTSCGEQWAAISEADEAPPPAVDPEPAEEEPPAPAPTQVTAPATMQVTAHAPMQVTAHAPMQVTAPGPIQVTAPAPMPAVTAMDRLAAPALRPPRSVGLIAAWVATVVVLASAAVATLVWRGPIVRAWPSSGWILGTEHPVAAIPRQTVDVPQAARE